MYLALPALVYFLISTTSRLDIGFRHILPIFPFLIVLIAAAAWGLMQQSRAWAYVVGALLLLHVGSSLHAFPYYLTYSNEAWGGPKNTYKYLSDANAGWDSDLKAVRDYVAAHQISDCWFAYSGLAPFPYYKIPCRVLPTFMSANDGTERGPIPESIEGTILLDEEEHAGIWWGPGKLNPYSEFINLHPDDIIAGETLVYHGRFDMHDASAISHLHAADTLLRMGKPDQALPEFQTALAMNPNSVAAHVDYGVMLFLTNKRNEAQAEFQKASEIAHTQYADFQGPTFDNLVLPALRAMTH